MKLQIKEKNWNCILENFYVKFSRKNFNWITGGLFVDKGSGSGWPKKTVSDRIRNNDTNSQGQIEYRSRIENWRILWVTSPGDSTALSQGSYIWPAELRNLHSQTFILEMLQTPSIMNQIHLKKR